MVCFAKIVRKSMIAIVILSGAAYGSPPFVVCGLLPELSLAGAAGFWWAWIAWY
jgi:hypothetical protein